ncbi:MAG TPA: transglycosylase SLT domain-containing protein, partial [Longimicrobiales bacterium]|nr:transglycosylase SLT domain-containing protein [Longimicrobiales bacterium]
MTLEQDRNESEGLDPGSGPFQAPDPRDRPWAIAEADHGPFERRRSADRRGPELLSLKDRDEGDAEASEAAGGRRRRWGRRKADVLGLDGSVINEGLRLARRLREPLIGLALAGVAAPLINAGMSPSDVVPGGAKKSATTAGSATAEGDFEAAVGDRWAEAEEAAVREQTIEGAIARYGIDRGLADQIYEAAERHAIEPDMAYGLVNTESTFRDRAVSHVGARGLTQVMPRTAQWLDPTISTAELFNRDRNLDLGFKYLRMMIDKYGG